MRCGTPSSESRLSPGFLIRTPGDPDWKPLRHYFGIDAFGANVFVQPEAGGRLVVDRRETDTDHQELYVVLEGRAEFLVDGEPYECPRGTCVAIPDPGVKRSAMAVDGGTSVLVIAATSGKP